MAQNNVMENRAVSSSKKGFALIEVMIAVLIIGVIAGGAIYFGMGALERTYRRSTKTKLQMIQLALMDYKNEKDKYPASLDELVKAAFLKKPLPKDGWDKPFFYRATPDAKKPYELFSHGQKGKGGGKESRIYAD